MTVQLRGHTISSSDGTGSGITIGTPDTCVSGVRLIGGTIVGFANGITNGDSCEWRLLPTSPRSVASRLTLTDNTWGIRLFEGYPIDVDRTSITGPNGVGSPDVCCSAGDVHVMHSTVTVTDPAGINVGAVGWGTTVQSSRLQGGESLTALDGPLVISGSRLADVTLYCSGSEIEITNSHLVASPLSSIDCAENVAGNRFTGTGAGTAVVVDSDFYTDGHGDAFVMANSFRGWSTAVTLNSGSGIEISGNTFRDNGTGVPSCSHNGCTKNGSVTDNRFLHNSGAGLQLTVGTWHVGSNVALRNGGLGIDAEGPNVTVIDDGGNIARQNQPPQCIGVVCAP